mgnify:CR=1 FL=1
MNKFIKYNVPLALVGLVTVVLSFQNCGGPQFGAFSDSSSGSQFGVDFDDDDSFSGSYPNHPGGGGNGGSTPAPRTLKTYDFMVQSIDRNAYVDIVWVVDNSGSMSAEAAHVRNNVKAFADKVGKSANVRMALISKYGTSGTGVYLPSGPDYVHIKQDVTSWDAVLLAASSMCATTNPSATCKQIDDASLFKPRTSSEPIATEIAHSKNIRGSLRSFLSKNEHSKKVFVFVTDDNSSWPIDKFLAIARENLNGQTPMVSAFVQLPNGKKCGDATGTAYVDLASKTGGAVYDICQTDWTATFDALAKHVEKGIENVFTLPNSIKGKDVVSVLHNGFPVNPKNYQVTDNSIRIVQSYTLYPGDLVQVVYQAK